MTRKLLTLLIFVMLIIGCTFYYFLQINHPAKTFTEAPTVAGIKPYWGEPIDVDNDGETEKIYYYAVAMTQSPHVAQIIKNDKVIFEKEAPRINISKTDDNKGYYLSEYAGLDGTKTTRYQYVNGSFKQEESTYKN